MISPIEKSESGIAIRINPGLWTAALAIIIAIVSVTAAILSRTTRAEVSEAVSTGVAPIRTEVQYLKESVDRMTKAYEAQKKEKEE